MQSAKTYIPCVLLTIILVFSMLGTVICITADKVILNNQTCLEIISEKKISETIKNLLEKNYKQKDNSTGIPAEVYTDVLTEKYIDNIVKLNVIEGFEYLNGNTDKFSVSPPFESLDKNITDFFSNYAEENGYVKDSSYYDKLQKEISHAHSTVISYTDIFKLDTLNKNGVLSQARRYISIKYHISVSVLIYSVYCFYCFYA